MLTLIAILLFAALIITIMHAVKGWPLWVAVLFLIVIDFVRYLPSGYLHG